MSFLTPKISVPPPPEPPEMPDQTDQARAAAMAEEGMAAKARRRKGRGSTIVAGALGQTASGQTPTLLG
tara:strand:+ start:286 stop:492 length:207 start_codon:yes stop_codon:yes gene_type:complete